ncbi:SEC-C metal-binding domain-containing protein [Pseudomonas sp. NPDC088444]|uniref:SEC-C metal-binding domain-containing protein n=1 Tax=Pseudomonas sp. NPDC088444 TaxID=3364456 RepID=UPI00384D9597
MSESHTQSHAELLEHLNEQLDFIQSSAEAFDNGKISEAKRIALAIRILAHDTKRSKSLLSQLDRKSTLFWDTAESFNPDNVLTYSGLILAHISNGTEATYRPILDSFAGKLPKLVDFDKWWSATVFVDSSKRPLSRKDLVLSMADKDGGAHVDPELNGVYADLSRKNSLGALFMASGESQGQPIDGAERAAIRQIGHEVLKTFLNGYSKDVVNTSGMMVAGVTMLVGDAATRRANELEAGNARVTGGHRPIAKKKKVGRNEICPCGTSGKKFKHCCGSV